jgi:hypothetical protein
MKSKIAGVLGVSANMETTRGVNAKKVVENEYFITCRDKDGNLKWSDLFCNEVVIVGLNDSLDKHLKGSAYTAVWYVGLMSATPITAPSDTMASHVGWTEVTDYDEATREVLILGTVAAGSVDNTASKASFTMNASVNVGGAFIASGSGKGETASILYGGGALDGGNKPVDATDVLNVTVVCSAATA